MSDLRAQLESTLSGSYTIERELGGGGMSRVFVALERSLDRRVVIKVLSPELIAGVSAQRFAREIRLAASLQQANIVPVLSSGEVAGAPYYTMPFVEGQSLRDRLRRDPPIAVPEAVSVLRDVARALAYAHQHGVVHRDIKPDNVLLSGHAAVVTDFGIAKALTAARQGGQSDAPATTFTSAGMAIGTPAYMAPEQIAGDKNIDHRADFYSFGCLAYELLTGKPPFEGRTAGGLLAAHLSENPTAVEERCSDCPESLALLVMQCLEKDPDRRPQSAAAILAGLEGDMSGPSFTFIPRTRRRRLAMAALFAVLVISLSVFVASKRSSASAPSPASTKSIAVLPFLNEGGDSTQEYLSSGMADGLATALGKVSGIRVISRTLTYRYRGLRDVNAQSVGKALDAGYLVHATLRRVGERLRLSAQVLNASDNSEFWSEDYERDSQQAYSIQDDLASDVAIALQGKTSTRGNLASLRSATSSGTSDAEAYDLYLRGRYLLERRGPGVAQAVKNFEQAIARDSTFARAYAALSVALELLPYFSDTDARAVGVRAIPAAKRALALDTTLAEAHTALGIAYSHAWQWDQSLAEHRHAVALSPEDASARLQYGRVLHYTGHVSEAKTQFERARMLDPYSAVASGWFGHLLSLTGHNDEAIVESNRAMQLDSVNPPALYMASQVHTVVGDSAKALIFAERLWNRVPQWRSPAAGLLARLGHRERALALLKTAKDARVRPENYKSGAATLLHLAIGDTAAALTDMERSAALRTNFPTSYSLSEREFDPLRRSARFAAIVRSVGLDERIFTSPTGGRPQ